MTRDPRVDPKKGDVTSTVNDVGYELRRNVERVREHGQRVDYSVTDSLTGLATTGYTVEIREWRSRNRRAEVVHTA